MGLPHEKKHNKPVVVVVNKSDIWLPLLNVPMREHPYVADPTFPVVGLDVGHVEDVSFGLRYLMKQVCPEVVSAVEDFAEHVTYVPVSTIGHSPTRNPATGALEVRPMDIRPHWVSVPFLYVLSKLGLVYRAHPQQEDVPAAAIEARFPGLLVCRLPDGSELEIPEQYSGRVLHDPRTGVPFYLPKV